jgi:hypothetical protein
MGLPVANPNVGNDVLWADATSDLQSWVMNGQFGQAAPDSAGTPSELLDDGTAEFLWSRKDTGNTDDGITQSDNRLFGEAAQPQFADNTQARTSLVWDYMSGPAPNSSVQGLTMWPAADLPSFATLMGPPLTLAGDPSHSGIEPGSLLWNADGNTATTADRSIGADAGLHAVGTLLADQPGVAAPLSNPDGTKLASATLAPGFDPTLLSNLHLTNPGSP